MIVHISLPSVFNSGNCAHNNIHKSGLLSLRYEYDVRRFFFFFFVGGGGGFGVFFIDHAK